MTERRELSAPDLTRHTNFIFSVAASLGKMSRTGSELKELSADAVVAERKTKAARLGHNSN